MVSAPLVHIRQVNRMRAEAEERMLAAEKEEEDELARLKQRLNAQRAERKAARQARLERGPSGQSLALGTGHVTIVSYTQCCLLYTSPSPRDATLSRMPSSA